MESKNLDLQFELKNLNEKTGEFEGLASPYMNVDNGNDRIMPTIAKANEGRIVPYLWQHDTTIIIGKVQMYNSNLGIMIKGKLFLNLIPGTQTPQVPKAHEAYANMKAGLLANSIGYVVKENGAFYDKQGVRNLTDIIIKEVSAVTFAMNEQAKITSVKNNGGESVEDNKPTEKVEEKAMVTMKQMMDAKIARRTMGMLMDTMYDNMRMTMNSPMTKEARMLYMNQSVEEFAAMYKENMMKMIMAMPDEMPKSDEMKFDIKSFEELEIKAGAKFSKQTKNQMMKICDMMGKGVSELNKMIDGMEMPKSDEKPETKETPEEVETIETKSDDDGLLIKLQELERSMKGDNK